MIQRKLWSLLGITLGIGISLLAYSQSILILLEVKAGTDTAEHLADTAELKVDTAMMDIIHYNQMSIQKELRAAMFLEDP